MREIRVDTVLSALMHPLLLPTYGILLWMRTPFVSLTGVGVLVFLVSTVVLTCLLPAVVIYRGWRRGDIDNLRISDREQRSQPFMVAFIGYASWALLFVAFRQLFFFPVYKMALGGALAVGLVWLISRWWKISAHLTGWGAFSAALAYYEFFMCQNDFQLLWLLTVFGALLVWARVRINHTPEQVLAGWLLGVASVCVMACLK